jgi:hypothetical protein
MIVTNLQVQPEIWGNLPIFRQSKGGTPSNFWATVEDIINPIDVPFDILAAVKRTAIPHHATFLGWSLNGVDADSEKRLIA